MECKWLTCGNNTDKKCTLSKEDMKECIENGYNMRGYDISKGKLQL